MALAHPFQTRRSRHKDQQRKAEARRQAKERKATKGKTQSPEVPEFSVKQPYVTGTMKVRIIPFIQRKKRA